MPSGTPFVVAIPEADLADLRARLARTRWPDELTGVGWELGTPRGYLEDLAAYWADGYDWRAQEAMLNGYEQTLWELDGAQVHVVHVRSKHADALPLVMTHGWPGSIVELLDVIGPLTDPPDPADAFHLILPTLPGYGLSGPTRERGWDAVRIAKAWAQLMAGLGYERYGAQGGDWGSRVSRFLGWAGGEHVVGVHLNFLTTRGTREAERRLGGFTDEERGKLAALKAFMDDGSGYNHLQSTRPQTLAYALTDSPVGQLSWIVEKLHAWTDRGGGELPPLDRDRMLTNVMLYWLTRTAGSSARLYYELTHGPRTEWEHAPSPAPVGLAVFPHEIAPPVRRIAELSNRIVRWTELERGGHFAAWEAPDLLVEDVRAFFRPLR